MRQHFADIGHDESVHDVTYENGQARERTQILMDIANQTNGMVIGTGDMSELALGWACKKYKKYYKNNTNTITITQATISFTNGLSIIAIRG